MKRVLVTGGAGFIGSHLCERLLNDGCDVICMDNYFSGDKANITHLMSNPCFEVVRHDVIDPYKVEVDEIYNLACPSSPIHYHYNPIKTTRTSIIGALNMLDLARHSHAKIIQASTGEVYGDPLVHPQSEDYWGNVNPIGTRACYEESKRCTETLCINYHIRKEVDVKIARIFNVFGPKMHVASGSVLSNFIMQALRGEEIVINGTGEQKRTFLYIDDLVEGLIRLMDTPSDFTGPINIGSPVEISIAQLAEKIIELTGSSSKLTFHELPEDDPNHRCPDITLAKNKLNWEPTISFEEGMLKTIEYFKGKI